MPSSSLQPMSNQNLSIHFHLWGLPGQSGGGGEDGRPPQANHNQQAFPQVQRNQKPSTVILKYIDGLNKRIKKMTDPCLLICSRLNFQRFSIQWPVYIPLNRSIYVWPRNWRPSTKRSPMLRNLLRTRRCPAAYKQHLKWGLCVKLFFDFSLL